MTDFLFLQLPGFDRGEPSGKTLIKKIVISLLLLRHLKFE